MVEINTSQCDTVNDILAMESLTSYDKVLRFVEEQESIQNPFFSESTETSLPENVQDIISMTNVDSFHVDKKLSCTKTRVSNQPTRKVSRQKRRRNENSDFVDDDSLLLFRRSQKALRNEARHVNMKKVLSRSLSGAVDMANDATDSLSVNTTVDPQQSSTWSPLLVTSITNRFLSSVQQQKKQVFERLMQKEITNSQLSISRFTAEKCGSDHSLPELVIGDETAIMEPPTTEKNVFGMEVDVTLSQTNTTPITAAVTNSTTSQNVDGIDEIEEQARSDALMRKHELWRLRQRHLREKLNVEESVSLEKSGDSQRTARAQVVLSTTTATTATTTTTTTSVQAAYLAATDADGLTEGLILSQRGIIGRTQKNSLGLSADHIDMIRRVNSFDNTISQRVVVFESKNSKLCKGSSSTKQDVV